jgi:predicted dehydrogenase
VRRVEAAFGFEGVGAGNYRLDPAHGGGALYDVGCYAVSAALWAFGFPPRSALARQRIGATGVDVATDATLRFDAGEAMIHAGMAEPPDQRLVIEGDSGTLECPEAPYTAWLGQHTEIVLSRDGKTERIRTGEADAYRLMVEDVSASIRGRDAWVLPRAETRVGAAVLDACIVSAGTAGADVRVGER